jgi:hypothetical protein
MALQECFFQEPMLPVLKRWCTSVKDKAIPLLPNVPRCNHKDFHEEFIAKLMLGLIHHGAEI